MAEERVVTGRTGPVVLDIGGTVGAVVVHVDGALLGAEIEVRRRDDASRRAHASVLERPSAARPQYAVVIGGLDQGEYTVHRPDGSAWGEVTVRGGEVVDIDRRGSSPQHTAPDHGAHDHGAHDDAAHDHAPHEASRA